MTMTPVFATSALRGGLDAMLAVLNVGGAGTIQIFTGSMPASTLSADSGTKLATLTLSATSFPASTDSGTGTAVATANTITSDTNAANTGTAGYFRAKTNGGTTIVQGTVDVANADLILAGVSTAAIFAGDTVAVSSWIVSWAGGSSS